MALLSVNIDHVATIRQARYRGSSEHDARHLWGEPDVVRACHEVELGGAQGVTIHLREDRRHVTDRDVRLLRELVRVEFNLEMAATPAMVAIAKATKPHSAMLVPEGRNEVTTEGGLDVSGKSRELAGVVASLKESGCRVSAFIDADATQIAAAATLGFDVCEIHTGPYAHAFALAGGNERDAGLARELARVRDAIHRVRDAGLACNAGHALNYVNVQPIVPLLGPLGVLHIGHAIISRAIFTGLREATAQMLAIARG
jgi:pyridoxine 5-phosphate synthase